MIFLIRYNRPNGRLVAIKRFADRVEAQNERLSLELRLHREQVDDEVVLLEAADEQVLRKTHRRYFESLEELLQTPLE